MIEDPGQPPISPVTPEPAPQADVPPPPPQPYPFWGFGDLFLVAALALPCMFLGFVLVRGVEWVAGIQKLPPGLETLAAMLAGYLLAFSCLAAVMRIQYDKPFWRSLGWAPFDVPWAWVILAGFGTQLLVGIIGYFVLHLGPAKGPLIELMKEPKTLIPIAIFGVTGAPLAEELAFRGFLQPLLVRHLGAVAGIVISAGLFGGLHYQEYGSSWQFALVIALSGVAFGVMRHRTQSTKAAVLMHAAFNGVSFLDMIGRMIF